MSRTRRLLVAYDGSSAARWALLRAAEVARRGDLVGVVNVMPEPGVSSRLAPPVEERDHQARLLDEAERCLARRGIAAQRLAPVGSAATEIVAAAERMGADMIVVARRSRRIPRVLGSVSGRVVRRARCDVLVVRDAGALPTPPDRLDGILSRRPPSLRRP
jgi:nucleotide-binding universal stress UspA family protein